MVRIGRVDSIDGPVAADTTACDTAKYCYRLFSSAVNALCGGDPRPDLECCQCADVGQSGHVGERKQ